MDDIISKLSAIEDAAVSILEDANIEKKRLADEMDKRTAEWDLKIHSDTDKTIADIEAKAKQSQKADIEARQARACKIIISLQENYDKNHTKYVDELFSSITEE